VEAVKTVHIVVTSRAQEACGACTFTVKRHRLPTSVFRQVSACAVRRLREEVEGLACVLDRKISELSGALLRRTEAQLCRSHLIN
jgi:hypothetical protein